MPIKHSKPPAAPRAKKAEILHGISDPRLIAAYAAAQPWLRRPNVTGIGIGFVWEKGRPTEEIGLCVHVTSRIADEKLTGRQRFPRTLLGVRVDVIKSNLKAHLSPEELDERRRIASIPIRPGTLIKSPAGELGTIALLVMSRSSAAPYVLGSGHVMMAAGNQFFQPNPTTKNALGLTVERVERALGDAAIASYSGRSINNRPIGFNKRITSIRPVQLGDELLMSGAFSGVTKGVVDSVGMKYFPYEDGGINVPGFNIRPKIAGTVLSVNGDSGALWYDASGAGVGINVGGEGGAQPWAFASHLVDMMTLLDVEI
ncbi:S1 family peptidase [Acidovorax sp. NCPPB 2350]|nr:S1 family peptidase [Acidovorax sp. NCPPB 2350]